MFHELVKFEQKQVTDPVIASFLRMKTSKLTSQNGDSWLFVLQESADDLYHDHYCYRCGRHLPYPVQTCVYCGTKVNSTVYTPNNDSSIMPTTGMWYHWTIDGELLR